MLAFELLRYEHHRRNAFYRRSSRCPRSSIRRNSTATRLSICRRYVAPDDELFDKTDDEIEEIFLDGLEKMYPHFSRKDVVAFKISRSAGLSVPVLNYSSDLMPMKTSVDGVHVVNSSHIVNGTLNINETVQLGGKTRSTEIDFCPSR